MGYITVDAVDETGASCEALVSSSEPPRIGDWFDDDGRRLRRVPSRVEARVKNSISAQLSWQLHREWQLKPGMTRAPKYDDRGRAVFDSRKQIDEYVAAHNDNPNMGTQIAWDPDGNE